MSAPRTTVLLLLISRHVRRLRTEDNQRCADVRSSIVHAFFTMRVPPRSRVESKLQPSSSCSDFYPLEPEE